MPSASAASRSARLVMLFEPGICTLASSRSTGVIVWMVIAYNFLQSGWPILPPRRPDTKFIRTWCLGDYIKRTGSWELKREREVNHNQPILPVRDRPQAMLAERARQFFGR